MIEVLREISEEEYEKAKENNPYVLINDSILMGYGAYAAHVYERDDKYFLRYDRGDSCD